MYWIIGFITVLGILTGIYMIIKNKKANGIVCVVLAIVCTFIPVWFCSLKENRMFGGTDWEFMIQSATVDYEIYPWILLILLAVEVILITETIFKLLKSKTLTKINSK